MSRSRAAADEAIEALYREHAGYGIRLAFLVSGDAHGAEDLCQEAFIRVASRARVPLDDIESFRGYLRTTIIRLSASEHRSRSRRERREQTAQPRVADGASDPLEHQIDDDLRVALMELPVRQRSAIVLRYWDDLDDHQIAATLGCAAGTARSLLSRGNAALRASLASEEVMSDDRD